MVYKLFTLVRRVVNARLRDSPLESWHNNHRNVRGPNLEQ